jgi:hypothetical protein
LLFEIKKEGGNKEQKRMRGEQFILEHEIIHGAG